MTSVTRTAVITGVGRRRGIGAGLAAGLAADGWDLVLSYWRPYDDRLGYEAGPDDPEAVAGELRDAHDVRVELVPVDLADPDAAGALLLEARRRLGPVSALVMSHCESVDSDVLTTTVESFDRHYAVNVRASWLLVKAFVEQLPDAGGSVVALTSDHTVGNLPYGATKGALDRLVLAAAHELGGRGLRANVVNPGPVDTGWMEPAWREELTALQPTGRLGTPADIADTVRFLLSDQGRWITGQVLHVDGGFPLGRLPV
ncbi:SDR family oxidoreductase [Jatrophihabitans sp. YIM 134969]